MNGSGGSTGGGSSGMPGFASPSSSSLGDVGAGGQHYSASFGSLNLLMGSHPRADDEAGMGEQ
jgi:hypothetical protein